MFQFKNFPIYIKTESFLESIQSILDNCELDPIIHDQLRRASTSVLLNFSEGAGKFSPNDKKNYYIIARGSAQECVAILDVLKIEKKISSELYNNLLNDLDELCRMLTGLINAMLKKANNR